MQVARRSSALEPKVKVEKRVKTLLSLARGTGDASDVRRPTSRKDLRLNSINRIRKILDRIRGFRGPTGLHRT